MATPLIKFKITPQDGDAYKVEVMSRDVLMWEKTGRDRSYAALMRQQDMVPMYALAYVASRRAGLFDGTLEQFETTCDLEPYDDDDQEGDDADRPTRPARSTTRRSRSR